MPTSCCERACLPAQVFQENIVNRELGVAFEQLDRFLEQNRKNCLCWRAKTLAVPPKSQM